MQATVSTPPRRRSRQTMRRLVRGVSAHTLLMLVALVFLIPFFWLISTSFKQPDQIFVEPPIWIPHPWRWQNYRDALTSPAFPYVKLLRNTLLYTISSTTGVIVSSTMVAYAFARMQFRGRDLLFAITLGTLLLPSVATLIPTYLLFRRLGLIGGYAPLVLPMWFGSAFNIFLLRQFMLTIPTDLTDAARVDGAGDFIILWRVIVPLIKPALIVVGVLHFLYTWNDFIGPLIYLTDANTYPLVQGLFAFQTRATSIQWHLLMPATLAVTAPVIVLFFVFQRYFIEGVTMTGLKGA